VTHEPLKSPAILLQKFVANGCKLWYGFFATKEVEYEQWHFCFGEEWEWFVWHEPKRRFFFNYVYFRLQEFYKKWDGENGITAIIGVSMIQAVTLIDLCLIVLKQYYSRSETKEYSKIFGYTGVIFLIVLIIFNHFKFKDSFEKFQIIWKDETLQRRRVKGLAVFISLILPWVLLIFIGTK
jgi:hypothetical protein